MIRNAAHRETVDIRFGRALQIEGITDIWPFGFSWCLRHWDYYMKCLSKGSHFNTRVLISRVLCTYIGNVRVGPLSTVTVKPGLQTHMQAQILRSHLVVGLRVH